MLKEEKAITGYPSIDKPWLKYYNKEAVNEPLPNCTIYEYLWINNKDYPKDIAINYYGRKITYAELFQNIDKTAAAFLALNVRPKEIVTVALPSIPEALYVVYALNKIGAVANMIHPLAGEQEILHYLCEEESRVAVIFDGTYEVIKASIENTSLERVIVTSAGCSLPFVIKQLFYLKKKKKKLLKSSALQNWDSFIKTGREEAIHKVEKNPSEMAIISHTGGTTGEPKGVMCSDLNINAMIWQIGVIAHKRQERCLVVLPPFINYSLVDGMLAPLALGIEVVLIPDYKPENFVDYINKFHPNIISSIPPYWEALLSINNAGQTDYSCLTQIFSGGEGMSIETLNKVNDLLISGGAQRRISSGLGCTELVSAASFTHEECYYPGSAGQPMPRVNCKIVIPGTYDEVPVNVEGEICFSGPTVMIGYYNNPEATSEIIKTHKDNKRWLHTGDLGYMNEEGVIFVTGRIKRILMTKGKDGNITKIFPDRIEKTLSTHPAIKLCCVIGIPDKERVHYPKAFVELNDGFLYSNELSNEIREYCIGKLPDYQIPDEIEFCEALPRTEHGKVDYRSLEMMAK